MISDYDYMRPSKSTMLAPYDQASQHPTFGASEDRGTPEEFLQWARLRPHPSMSEPTPLPAEIDDAIQFTWRLGSEVASERRLRMNTLRDVACALEPLTKIMAATMCPAAVHIARAMRLNLMRRERPDATLADVGDEINTPHYGLWCVILDTIRWPHRTLVRSMLHGFRSVAELPDSGVWRPVERPASMPFAAFAATNAAWVVRCQQRVLATARKDPAQTLACWKRTIEERDAGLILGPYTVNQVNQPRSKGPPARGYGNHRPLPRHAIWQGAKYRCIDDAAVSETNEGGTSYREMIVCDRPDYPLRIGQRFHDLGPPPMEPGTIVAMGGGAEDAFAAYRRVVTADGEYTEVMVAVPPGELGPDSPLCVRIFDVVGHNFGLVSSVLNWHNQAEPPLVFSRRYFGTPVTKFYDDHSISEPSYANGSGQEVHFELHEILRFHFDIKKHVPWSPVVLYTGVETDWSRDGEGLVTIGVTRERRARLQKTIAEVLALGVMTSSDASSLRGKARFCVSPVFGRVGIAVVQLLRERQMDHSRTDIDEQLASALQLLDIVVDLLPNFPVRLHRDRIRPAVVILTDASFATGHTWLGFLVICPMRGACWAGCATPLWLMNLLERHKKRQTYIGQLEQAGASAPYESLPAEWLEGRPVMHYIDNQGALYSLINGRSKDHDSNRLVFVTLMRAAKLSCNVWFDYVPSAANIADLPTRLDDDAIMRLNRVARRVPLRLPEEWCLECEHHKLKQLFV